MQLSELNDYKMGLDRKIVSLKKQIEDIDSDIQYKEEENQKMKENMEFINQLIREFRPWLYPEGGLKPLNSWEVKMAEKQQKYRD